MSRKQEQLVIDNDAFVIETEFTISAQHPSLSGHFPGNPIVPGVVILEEIIRHIKQALPDHRCSAIPAVKFTAPLKAGVVVTLSVVEKQPALMSFSCQVGESRICSGQLRLEKVE